MLECFLRAMQDAFVRYANKYNNLLRYGTFLKIAPEKDDIIDFAKKSCRLVYLSKSSSREFLEASYNLNRASYEYFSALKIGLESKIEDCEHFASNTALFAKKTFNATRKKDLESRRDWCKKWLKYELEAYSKNKNKFFYEFNVGHAGLSLFKVNKKMLYTTPAGRKREAIISESKEILEQSIYTVKDATKRFADVIIRETNLSNRLCYEEEYKRYLTFLLKLEFSKLIFFQKNNAPITSNTLDFAVESTEIMEDEHSKKIILSKTGGLMKLYGIITNNTDLLDKGEELVQNNFFLASHT